MLAGTDSVICLNTSAENLTFGKFLENGMLFPEFMNCCWLHESAS